ncbi:MAG: hypothetical protein Q4E35_06745 [Eubacteriales bacterium]|nr:hypothetical protein [Eubacteriales bacterium]
MRERIARFMAGRNGNDQFNMALLIAAAVSLLLGSILRGSIGGLFTLLVPVLLIYSYFRMLSRNIYKRQEENGKYLRLRYKLISRFNVLKERWKQRKDYKFFTCPSCHAALRVPRGRGKIKIVCRKCGNSFEGRS